MRQVHFHIGPHKTGSSYIQRMMHVNAHLFPTSHQPLSKFDPFFLNLHQATLNLHSRCDVPNYLPAIHAVATELAHTLKARRTLLSSEDLLGPLPTRANIDGLYPFATETLPTIKRAFSDQNLNTIFHFYIRPFDDWLSSLHSYKYRAYPRAFAPTRFRTRFHLPKCWSQTVVALQSVLGRDALRIHSFTNDRATNRFGTALFQAFGLTNLTLNTFDWVAPVNVSRAQTINPSTW